MYKQEISRENKGLFIFLLDQSYSMEEPLGNSKNKKMDELALAINSWLANIAIRSTGSDGVRDYLDIAILGYRTDDEANPIIESALGGALAGKMLASLPEIYLNPLRTEKKTKQIYDDETGELMATDSEVLVWVEPKAEGGTPMCSVLYKAHEIASQWIAEHPRSYPPIVIHITDGESQEGDPIPYADPLRELETEDGKLLLFNCHLSMTPADAILFPHSDEIMPDDQARTLYKMSSVLPDDMIKVAQGEGFQLQANARGMCFNADMVTLIKFLNMGTRPAEKKPQLR